MHLILAYNSQREMVQIFRRTNLRPCVKLRPVFYSMMLSRRKEVGLLARRALLVRQKRIHIHEFEVDTAWHKAS